MYKGTLSQVLEKIGEQLSLSSDKLITYAAAAPYAEKRPDGKPWPSGTGSISEKRILYAITRALRCVWCLDLGTRWGSMTLQIVSANKAQNTAYLKTTSIDIETHIHGSKTPVGKFIPKNFNVDVDLVTSDVVQYLKQDKFEHELIFEDTAHTYDMTKAIYELAVDRLTPGGVIISHDACHPKFKGAVVKGIKATGIEPNVYLVEGDSCGLAIWQKPKLKLQIANFEADVEIQDTPKADTKAAEEKPKRRKRRRKKTSKSVAGENIKEGIEDGQIVVNARVSGLINEMKFYKWDVRDGEPTCGSCKDKGELPMYRLKDWTKKTSKSVEPVPMPIVTWGNDDE